MRKSKRWLVAALVVGGAFAAYAFCDFSAFTRNRSRFEDAVERARASFAAGASLSSVPGCGARVTSFRTAEAEGLERRTTTSPDVEAWQRTDGQLLVLIRESDVHGFARSYAFANPAMTAHQLGTMFDACGGGEWEEVSSLEDGWFELVSHLD